MKVKARVTSVNLERVLHELKLIDISEEECKSFLRNNQGIQL